MIVTISGIRFEIEPDDYLLGSDREYLSTFPQVATSGSPFHLALTNCPTSDGPRAQREAELVTAGDEFVLRHADFAAVIQPHESKALLTRQRPTNQAFFSTLRVAMTSTMPLRETVVLHAASVLIAGRVSIFFGPSEIGKSTLMKASPHPVLGDEWCAVSTGPSGATARAAPFWSSYWSPGTILIDGEFPVAALVALERADHAYVEPLTRAEVLHRLLPCVLVPPSRRLWQRALDIAGRLVEQVPGYRMAWQLGSPPWSMLAAATHEPS